MLRIIFALSAALLAAPAFAQSADATADSNSNSASQSQASSQNIFQGGDSIYPANQRIRNTPGVGLAAATNSFSSDYCGGTAQAGVSGPGFSLGGSKQAYDTNCQALRRAEKFGQLAVTAHNLQQHSQSLRLLNMSIFEVCSLDEDTVEMCLEQELVILRNK